MVGSPNGTVMTHAVQGSLHVYRIDGSDNWQHVQELLPSDSENSDTFGFSVSISGSIAIAGRYADESAYLFSDNGSGGWSEIGKIRAAGVPDIRGFGGEVAISGDTAIVGAAGENNSGAVYVFRPEGVADWHQVKRLVPSDIQSNDRFGGEIAISGNTAVMGVGNRSDAGFSSGAAYFFRDDGSGNWTEQKVLASDAAPYKSFGTSVSISGDTAVICGPGAAYVFRDNGAGIWSEVTKLVPSDGSHINGPAAIDGNLVVVSGLIDGSDTIAGKAFVFQEDQVGVWSQIAELRPSDSAIYDQFGSNVAISDGRVLIGAYGNNNSTGAAYIFTVPEPCSLAYLAAAGLACFATRRPTARSKGSTPS